MEFTQEESAALRAEYGKGSNDSQWEVFLSECKANDLRPGTHLVFQLRNAKEYDSTIGASVFVKRAYWITTIGALRLIAQRTGEYQGQGEEEYIYLDSEGMPTITSNIPLPEPGKKLTPREPWVVRTKVYRKGFTEPMVGIARFEAYAGLTKDGKLTEMWSKRGSEQLSKCSEALALRKAFPAEMSKYYIAEELKNDEPDAPQQQPVSLTPAPTAPVVPQVDQTPAEPTDAPRPNEPVHSLEELILHKPAGSMSEKKEESPVSAKPRRGRKPAEKTPEIGDMGITDADIALAGTPLPGEITEADRKAGQEFAEAVGGATPVPERLPTKEQKDAYVARVREIVKTHQIDNTTLGKFFLAKTGKNKSAEMTVGDWDGVFEVIDAGIAAGNLKELVTQ